MEQAYIACVWDAAGRVDNGSTGPDQVAAEIAPLCEPQFSRVKQIVGQDRTLADYQRFESALDRNELAGIAALVTKRRQSR